MQSHIIERVKEEANWMIENNATIRSAAKHFSWSKSTVHKDVTERLSELDKYLYTEMQKLLNKNSEERHIRGGEATRIKYLNNK